MKTSKTGQPLCIQYRCGRQATHRLAYGTTANGKQHIAYIYHCEKHATPHDEPLSTCPDREVTSHALCNALDMAIRQMALLEKYQARVEALEQALLDIYETCDWIDVHTIIDEVLDV